MSPRALITVRYQLKEELHITDALIVESDNCLCLQNITFEWWVFCKGFYDCKLAAFSVIDFGFLASCDSK